MNESAQEHPLMTAAIIGATAGGAYGTHKYLTSDSMAEYIKNPNGNKTVQNAAQKYRNVSEKIAKSFSNETANTSQKTGGKTYEAAKRYKEKMAKEVVKPKQASSKTAAAMKKSLEKSKNTANASKVAKNATKGNKTIEAMKKLRKIKK